MKRQLDRIDQQISIAMKCDHFETYSHSGLGGGDSALREGRGGTFKSEVTASINLDLRAWIPLPQAIITILGMDSDLVLDNFLWPNIAHQLTISNKKTGVQSTEKHYGLDGASPEEYQLGAFLRDVMYKIPTNPDLYVRFFFFFSLLEVVLTILRSGFVQEHGHL